MKTLIIILLVFGWTHLGVGQNCSLRANLLIKEDDNSTYRVVVHNKETKDTVQVNISNPTTKINIPLTPGAYNLIVYKNNNKDYEMADIKIVENMITFIPDIDFNIAKKTRKKKKRKKK